MRNNYLLLEGSTSLTDEEIEKALRPIDDWKAWVAYNLQIRVRPSWLTHWNATLTEEFEQ